MLVSDSASSRTSSVTPGDTASAGSDAVPVSPRLQAQRLRPVQLRGSRIPRLVLLSNTSNMISVSGGYDYYTGPSVPSWSTHLLPEWPPVCSFSAWRRGFGLREGSGLLDNERWVLFSCCRTGFISFPGEISRFPAQYTWSGQPSTTTQFHVILMDGLYLQARPDDSHGRKAKYASDVYKPGFGGCLFFNLSCYWFFGPSSRARFWPTLHG
jgi:hypothetical protein